MQVAIDEIGTDKIRGMQFYVGRPHSHGSNPNDRVFIAALDEKRTRWIVLDDILTEAGYVYVYTTDEMKLMYYSLKGHAGMTLRASEQCGYRCLVRASKLRMKLKEGCPGCRVFWRDAGAEGQCNKCHRCYKCCGREKVPFSCASGQKQEASKKQYTKRRRR